MHRKFLVCVELPPRQSLGADSRIRTLQPASRAMRAAQRAALPPPTTKTSSLGCDEVNEYSCDFERVIEVAWGKSAHVIGL